MFGFFMLPLEADKVRGHEVADTKTKAKINVLISIYGFAAVKHIAEFGGKSQKIKENSVMRKKTSGGLPPPEPPRTVKGPLLRSGGHI